MSEMQRVRLTLSDIATDPQLLADIEGIEHLDIHGPDEHERWAATVVIARDAGDEQRCASHMIWDITRVVGRCRVRRIERMA